MMRYVNLERDQVQGTVQQLSYGITTAYIRSTLRGIESSGRTLHIQRYEGRIAIPPMPHYWLAGTLPWVKLEMV